MRHPIALGLLSFALALAARRTDAQDQEAEIKKLIADLAGEKIETRAKAADRLKEIGEPAVRPLEAALESKDAEVVARVREVLEYIQIGKTAAGLSSDKEELRLRALAYLVRLAEGDSGSLEKLFKEWKKQDPKSLDRVSEAWSSPKGLLVVFLPSHSKIKKESRLEGKIVWLNVSDKKVGVSRFTSLHIARAIEVKPKWDCIVRGNCTHDHDGKEDCTAFELKPGELRSSPESLKLDGFAAGSHAVRAGQYLDGNQIVGPAMGFELVD